MYQNTSTPYYSIEIEIYVKVLYQDQYTCIIVYLESLLLF